VACWLPAAAQLQGSALPNDSQANVDCTDPVNAIYSSCASQPAQQPGAAGAGNPAASGDTPRSQRGEVNNQNYSDTGGLPRAERQSRLAERPEPPEPLSEFQKFVAATTGEVLPIFGASLFGNAPSTFAPLDQGPVTADYLLGPGDELLIRVWGQINFNASLRIDRSGNIYLPQVGAVHVAGLPYASVQEHVRSEIARVFRNFDLTVDMGQLRSIQVFVVGQVRRPGSYTISSLSTLINALFASGGPSTQGSLRRIQLKRQGQLVSTFDLYDLLLRGDKSKDVPLLPGDVIFVPTVGPQVALTGSARHPGIYELGDANTLGQLLADAGGPTPLASTARISIERLEDNAGRAAMEVGFDEAALKTTLRDGDLLRILSVVPAYQKTVTLRGNTANPGRFAWHPGMRISALIPDRASLITRNYWWQRTRLGLSGAEFEPDVTGPIQSQPPYPVNLESFPCVMRTADDDVPDRLATETPDTPCTPYERYNPNQLPQQYRYPQQAQGQLAGSSAQQAAGSPAPGASSSLGNQQTGQGESSLILKAATTDVKLVAPEIDWDYAVIERLDPSTLKTSLIPFNLGRLVLDHDQTQDLELQSGDVVSIFSQADIRVPIARQTRLVHLEGEFVSAGVYSVNPGETLRQLVIRAGGISPGAYLYGSEFTRESTRVLQQQRIHEYVRSLQLQITRGSIEQAATASSSQDVQQANVAAASEQELIRRLDQVRATGRIVFDIDADASSVDVLPEIALEDGDRFIIPPKPSTINVIGAVYDQNSFLYQQGSMLRDYLREAGGENRDADRKREFVIRADGSVISRQSRRVGNFHTARVHAGDTIVVPEKTFRPGSLRTLLAYTQIFSQLAFGAAAINVLQ
jgi:protein involved in polysaccharide export with SLBB domain